MFQHQAGKKTGKTRWRNRTKMRPLFNTGIKNKSLARRKRRNPTEAEVCREKQLLCYCQNPPSSWCTRCILGATNAKELAKEHPSLVWQSRPKRRHLTTQTTQFFFYSQSWCYGTRGVRGVHQTSISSLDDKAVCFCLAFVQAICLNSASVWCITDCHLLLARVCCFSSKSNERFVTKWTPCGLTR